MTKLWIFSDLHLSHDKKVGRAGLAVPDADICVCAGDIYHGMLSSVSWLEGHVLPHMPVIFVPGNHEYYDRVLVHDRDEYRERYRSGDLAPGFHFLDCDEAVIKGVRFLGATAWTDFELYGGTDSDKAWLMRAAEMGMNDYRVIAFAHHAERLTADHTRSLHREAKRWLWSAARTAFDGPAVVVTHHAPHPKSVAPQFEDVPLTAAYVSDMTATIQAVDPVLWIHGHVHDCFDYQVGATRVLCNPKGYSDENSRFNPSLVVEV